MKDSAIYTITDFTFNASTGEVRIYEVQDLKESFSRYGIGVLPEAQRQTELQNMVNELFSDGSVLAP